MDKPIDWAIIVHGGAKRIAPKLHERNRRGCIAAAEAGAAVLRAGGDAVAAAEAAVQALEDDPVFNAGFGSVTNSDGDVEMDAALMDGGTLALGGVAAVRRLRNPIRTARAMLTAPPVLLAAEGAERFAMAHGIELCDPQDMIASDPLASEGDLGRDTVGCVALDGAGNIAAATSTGGLPDKHPGRIGDSPIPGCGLYADSALGGVAFSGDGESILRTMLAARVMHGLEDRTAQEAVRHAIEQLARVDGEAGGIAIDAAGSFGMAHNSDHFAVALHAAGWSQPRSALHHSELKDICDD